MVKSAGLPGITVTAHEPLSDDLRRFIFTSIPSVPYLEAILQFRAPPRRALSPAKLGAALYVGEAAARDLIAAMMAAGIVRSVSNRADELYEYESSDPTLDSLIEKLVRAYTGDLVGVTRLIHDGTQRSAQRFSDAFKFTKGS